MSVNPPAQSVKFNTSPDLRVEKVTITHSGPYGADQVSVVPETIKRLDPEFENVQSKFEASRINLSQQRREFNDEQIRNTILKNRNAPPHMQVNTGVVTTENAQLEARLYQLEDELRSQRVRNQVPENLIRHTEGTEKKYQEREAENFLIKNRQTELSHLQRMLNIFEEENNRLKVLYDSRQKPSDQDIIFIKSNIARVRNEIDEILRARAELNFKYNELLAQIQRTNAENQMLKTQGIRQQDQSQITEITTLLNQRNNKIIELTNELAVLKSRIGLQPQPTRDSSSALRTELDQKNNKIRELENVLSVQNGNLDLLSNNCKQLASQLKSLQARLESSDPAPLQRELEASNKKLRNLEEENDSLRKEVNHLNKSFASTGIKTQGNTPGVTKEMYDSHVRTLEEENKTLKKKIEILSASKLQDNSDVSFSAEQPKVSDFGNGLFATPGRTPISDIKSVGGVKDQIIFSADKRILGNVSEEEMHLLERRVNEFGTYNDELESAVHRLKMKIAQLDDERGAYSEGGIHIKTGREEEKFEKLVNALQAQVDRLSMTNHMSIDAGHSSIRPVDYYTNSDNISDLKDKYKQLEIKYNTLLSLNMQNEIHIEKLISQIQDNKAYFQTLITQNEELKQREKDTEVQAAKLYQKSSQLQAQNDELSRTSLAIRTENQALQDQLKSFDQELKNLHHYQSSSKA